MNHCWQGSRVRLVSQQACDGRFVALRNRTFEPASQWAYPSAQTTERRCSPRSTICTKIVSSQKRVQNYKKIPHAQVFVGFFCLEGMISLFNHLNQFGRIAADSILIVSLSQRVSCLIRTLSASPAGSGSRGYAHVSVRPWRSRIWSSR